MNLCDFESNIEYKILNRGFDYFKSEDIISVDEISENVYEASVKGSSIYTVDVIMDENNNVITSGCSCPYNLGEYCKHEAAVFYYLREAKQ